jgi:methyl-accepting chemotaxis protein
LAIVGKTSSTSQIFHGLSGLIPRDLHMTIGRKLGFGFGAVLLLMVGSAVIVHRSVARMNTSVDTVVDRSFPTVSASHRMLSGLNHSVAALRGYIILGDDPKQGEKFKHERSLAWKNMDDTVSELARFYANTSDNEDRQRFKTIQDSIEELRAAQQIVEDVAQQEDNLPSHKLLFTEAAPAEKQLRAVITALIDSEQALEATPDRKKLLKTFSDFRDSLAASLSEIRSYLLTGKEAYRTEFEARWQLNEQAYLSIDNQQELFQGQQSELWEELKRQRRVFVTVPAKIFAARENSEWNRATFLMESKSAPMAALVRDSLEDLKEKTESQMRQERTNLDAASRTVTTTLVVATLLAIVTGSILAWLISRAMSVAVRRVLSEVQRVAGGDLSGQALQVNSRDELGALSQGFNKMVVSLRGILGETSMMTKEVATASRQIATGAQQQLTSLNETAASLNQITTTAEEFKATMQEFADRSRAVQEAADETAQLTVESRSLTQDSAARIEQVYANSQAAGQSVLNLAEQMQRIGENTATVNEIAEQTKLLALNASIEAARAGEEGRGFAVVATQVRELANQSKESAGRIEFLISDTQKSMQDVVTRIQNGGRLSQESVEIIGQLTKSFEEISLAIQQTREAMGQISTGAKQQEDGITELVTSITEIDSASQESVASAQQTQRSIVAIDQRIQSLNSTIAQFKT